MLVKNDMEEKATEQSFWQDTAAVVHVSCKRRLHAWPHHAQLIDHLSKYKQGLVDYAALRHLFPGWRRLKSMRAWIEHYSRYEFLDSQWHGNDKHDHHHGVPTKEHIAEELALLLGVAKPTAYERVKEQKRLEDLGQQERQERLRRAGPRHESKPWAPRQDGLDQVLLQGLVEKRGQLNPLYQPRFLRLERSGVLTYYKASEVLDKDGLRTKANWWRHARPCGRIALRGASVAADASDPASM